jgi:hypothetical protein
MSSVDEIFACKQLKDAVLKFIESDEEDMELQDILCDHCEEYDEKVQITIEKTASSWSVWVGTLDDDHIDFYHDGMVANDTSDIPLTWKSFVESFTEALQLNGIY